MRAERSPGMGLRGSASSVLSLALLVSLAILGAVESRIHPTRDQAAQRSVTELRSFDMWALDSAEVKFKPFPHVIVEKFVPKGRLAKISQDFPKGLREHVLEQKDLEAAMDFDSAFTNLLTDANSDALRDHLGHLFNIDLSQTRTRVSVRGACIETCNGTVRVDAKWKAMTVHIFLNENWRHQGDAGHLRLLKGPHIDKDAVVQIPSWRGNFVAWVNTPGAWNGFLPFRGQRRALMINYIWRPGVDRNPRVHLLHTPGPHPLLEHLPPVDGNDTFVIVNAPPPGAPPPPAQPEAPEAPPEGGADGDGGAEAGGLGLGGAQQEDGGSAWLNHPLAQAVVQPGEAEERSFSGFSIRNGGGVGLGASGFSVHGSGHGAGGHHGAAGASGARGGSATHFHAHTLSHQPAHSQPVGGRSAALAQRQNHIFSASPLAGGHFFESLAQKVSQHHAQEGIGAGIFSGIGGGGAGGADSGTTDEAAQYRR